ncbi:MAG: PAS domain S-box protein [Planctomycetota bacterium]
MFALVLLVRMANGSLSNDSSQDDSNQPADTGGVVTQATLSALSGVLNQAGCGLALFDPASHQIVDCNEALVRLFDAENRAAVCDRRLSDFCRAPQADGAGVEADISDWLSVETADEDACSQWIVTREDGSELTVQVSSTRADPSDSPLLLTAWVARDAPSSLAPQGTDSPDRFRRLVEGFTKEYILYGNDLQGNLTYLSPSVKAVLGYEPEQLVGKNWREFVPDEHYLASAEHYQEMAFQGRDTPPNLVEVLHADGSTRLLEVLPQPVRDRAGNILGVEGICKDVTQLKQTEAELVAITEQLDRRVHRRTAELQHRHDFEDLLINLSTRFINLPTEQIDEGLQDALRRIGEFIGVDRCFIYNIDDAEGEISLTHEWVAPGAPSFKEQMQGFPTAGFEWEIQQIIATRTLHIPDVEQMPAEAANLQRLYRQLGIRSAVNVPMLRGEKLIGFLGFVSIATSKQWQEEDIELVQVLAEMLVNARDRCQTERELRLSEERLRLAIETIGDGLFDWDVSGNVLYVSDHTLRSLDLPEGHNDRDPDRWRALIHPNDRARVEEALDAHLQGKSPIYEIEYRLKNHNGGYRWRHARGRVVERDANGNAVRMLGIDRDITDRVEQQTRLRGLEEQLVHLGRVATMGETVAGIAHEVNQPLHAAATFCAAARRALISGRADAIEKGVDLASKIAEQVTRAGDIIRRLREFTRPRPVVLKPVDFNAVIRESSRFMTQISDRHAIQLAFELEESLPEIHGDAIQLQQVVINLLQNASDSLESGGIAEPTIRVVSRLANERVELVISDNGPPCQIENLDAMFDAFFTTKPDGMGIGLSLCRTIVEAHQGSIQASKNQAGGLTIVASFPAAAEKAP